MAKVIAYAGDFNKLDNETWEEHRTRTSKLIDALYERSNALADNAVVGGIITFPVADGSAVYMVSKEKPLELIHIPFGDAWEASNITIRGLRVDDVKAMLNRNKCVSTLRALTDIPTLDEAKELIVSAKESATVDFKDKAMDNSAVDIKNRFDIAVDDAQAAFWGAIADSFPEIRSGDLPPDFIFNFNEAVKKTVAAWLIGNCSDEMDPGKLVPSKYLPED